MVSATDPARGRRDVQATDRCPHALSTLVDGESLLNDGTGLVLFAIAVRRSHAPIGAARRRRGLRRARSPSASLIGLVTGYVAAVVVTRWSTTT